MLVIMGCKTTLKSSTIHTTVKSSIRPGTNMLGCERRVQRSKNQKDPSLGCYRLATPLQNQQVLTRKTACLCISESLVTPSPNHPPDKPKPSNPMARSFIPKLITAMHPNNQPITNPHKRQNRRKGRHGTLVALPLQRHQSQAV